MENPFTIKSYESIIGYNNEGNVIMEKDNNKVLKIILKIFGY